MHQVQARQHHHQEQKDLQEPLQTVGESKFAGTGGRTSFIEAEEPRAPRESLKEPKKGTLRGREKESERMPLKEPR